MIQAADFAGLLQRLSQKGVDFIVIGGVAAIAHGSSRLTQDIDVVYSRKVDNLERLVTALSDIHPYLRGAPPDLPFTFDVETLRRGLNFTLVTDIGPIDLLGEIVGGGTYDALLPHSDRLTLFEVDCQCLNLEALIKAKRAAGRPKDFETIAELELLLDED